MLVRRTFPPLTPPTGRPRFGVRTRPRVVTAVPARLPDLNILFPQLLTLMGQVEEGFLLTIVLSPEPKKRPTGILLTEPFSIRFVGTGRNHGLVVNTQDFFFARALERHIQEVKRLKNSSSLKSKSSLPERNKS